MISASAASTLSGYIYDNDDITPLENCYVNVSGAGSYSTLSNSTGYYYIIIADGIYNIEYSKSGYYTQNYNNIEIPPSKIFFISMVSIPTGNITGIIIDAGVTLTTDNVIYTSDKNMSLINASVYSDTINFNDANLTITPTSGTALTTFHNITTVDNLTFTNNVSISNFTIQNGFANYTFIGGANYGLNNSTAYAANNTSTTSFITLNALIPADTYSLEMVVTAGDIISAISEALANMPYQLFIMLIFIDILLIYYSFTKKDQAYYTDIITSFMAICISLIIAHNSLIGMMIISPLKASIQYDTYLSIPMTILFIVAGMIMLLFGITKVLDVTHKEVV